MPLDPEQRSLINRAAAYESWAKTSDPAARTANGRKSFLSRFEAEVDPSGTLPVDQRLRRAEAAKRAYFLRLALKSAQARRRAA